MEEGGTIIDVNSQESKLYTVFFKQINVGCDPSSCLSITRIYNSRKSLN